MFEVRWQDPKLPELTLFHNVSTLKEAKADVSNLIKDGYRAWYSKIYRKEV